MPMKRELYPDDWEETSIRIRERDGNKCAWCGIPNGARIRRLVADPFVWKLADELQDAPYDELMLYGKLVKITLTVAHLNHTPSDCRDENLLSLCNRCHLKYDGKQHAANAKVTRAAKKHAAVKAAGQQELFDGA